MCFITFYKCLQLSINYTYWISLKKGSLTYVAAIFFFFFLVGSLLPHPSRTDVSAFRRRIPQWPPVYDNSEARIIGTHRAATC
ncbi:uncharacterized protein LOC112552585 isoform X2 [Pogonomyrmex barbatus]|uniref:Uncharacterized protein LOC112552585 isoform X2 n=1 Tax=Pogonomyrmex barbatus TaxID=144034 RepID=A0A8N1S4Z1_9HYME|nr:uncharacterized protein LOC112552585 isoform X2 [Pogonomyrmex barbatus]